MSEQIGPELASKDHLTWVRTRLTLERDFRDTTSRGFALIAAGFGSFAIFDGLAIGERRDELPLAFALAATAIGMAVIGLAIAHYRKMTAWVDTDQFGAQTALELPNERRSIILAGAAIAIGLASFIGLLVVVR